MQIEELKQTIQNEDAVMVYFSGEFCGVCKVLQSKIKEAFQNQFPKIKQVYISVDEYKQTAVEFGVFAVPTIIVFFDTKEFARKSRNLSVSGFVDELQRPYGLFFN
ncbi:MAG: thioredoxin family protein [Campylobacterota bacterium]|nr:thioredoxin family protein [Campylobacterota bacterium]